VLFAGLAIGYYPAFPDNLKYKIKRLLVGSDRFFMFFQTEVSIA